MIRREDVVTLDQIDEWGTAIELGQVSGRASRTRSMLRATFRSLGMLIGLAPIELLGDAERLREDALEHLRRQADGIGANAVAGVRFDVVESHDGTCTVRAAGRALRVARFEDERTA